MDRWRSCGLLLVEVLQLPQLPLRIATDEVIPTAVVRDLEFRRLNDVSRHQDHLSLLYCSVLSTKHPPIRSVLLLLVTTLVSDTAGLRKRNISWHSAIPAQAATIGDELCCSAGAILLTGVGQQCRPMTGRVVLPLCYSTPPSTTPANGRGANVKLACSV